MAFTRRTHISVGANAAATALLASSVKPQDRQYETVLGISPGQPRRVVARSAQVGSSPFASEAANPANTRAALVVGEEATR